MPTIAATRSQRRIILDDEFIILTAFGGRTSTVCFSKSMLATHIRKVKIGRI